MVGMVVMWIDPRPGSGCLSSVPRSGECQRWSDIEVWWPNNWVSAQSNVAINICCPWWLSQIWGLLVVSPHPTGASPPGVGPLFLPSWRHSTQFSACMNVLWNSVACVPDFMVVPIRLSTHLATISPSQTYTNTQECAYTRLAWKDPLLTRVEWNLCKSFFCTMNTCRCIKKSISIQQVCTARSRSSL